jgi:hypothetical protein
MRRDQKEYADVAYGMLAAFVIGLFFAMLSAFGLGSEMHWTVLIVGSGLFAGAFGTDTNAPPTVGVLGFLVSWGAYFGIAVILDFFWFG